MRVLRRGRFCRVRLGMKLRMEHRDIIALVVSMLRSLGLGINIYETYQMYELDIWVI